TGETATVQRWPSSSEYRIRPRSPTTTKRFPAFAESSSKTLFGNARASGTNAPGGVSPAAIAAGAGNEADTSNHTAVAVARPLTPVTRALAALRGTSMDSIMSDRPGSSGCAGTQGKPLRAGGAWLLGSHAPEFIRLEIGELAANAEF